MSLWVRDGAWRDVTSPHVVVNGQECAVVRGMVRVAGKWERFYPLTEITYTSIADGLSGAVAVGTPITVHGSVRAESGVISGGTVEVQQRRMGVNGPEAWFVVGSAAIGSGATVNWGLTVTPNRCGISEFKAVFKGTPTNQASESPVVEVDPVLVTTPEKPTGGAITTSSMALSWAAVSSATSYLVYDGGVFIAEVTAASYTHTNLTPGSSHTYTVKAKVLNADGLVCESALSPALVGKTSTVGARDTGTAKVKVNPAATGSFRNDTKDWTQVGDKVAQAFYTDATRIYTGMIDYGGAAAVKAAIEAALGANGALRFANGSPTDARVYLYRMSGVGLGSVITASFYVSDNAANVGAVAPVRKGTVVNVATSAQAVGKWYPIGALHAVAIAKGTARSVALYNADGGDVAPSNYTQFRGKTGGTVDDCDIEFDWSWDFVVGADVPGAWT